MHIPVLLKEVIQYLDPKANENFIDCTINGGGHALAILEKTNPSGKILGIDWDEKVISNLKSKTENLGLKNRLILSCNNFANLKEIVKKEKFQQISGILFDLGLSSWHLEESGRGFSFQKNEPLDMKFSSNKKNGELMAEKILNEYPESEIEKILKEYGEEKFSQTIARGIIVARQINPIKTTFQLVEVIKRYVPGWYQHQRMHFATKTFQALRIAGNDELKNLELALPRALEVLPNLGKIVVISFHSLEDRIVKNFFRAKAKEGNLKIIIKKPIRPSWAEIRKNPRSRSAVLRAAMKYV